MAMPPMPIGMLLRLILLSDETFQDTWEKQETAPRVKLGKLHLSDTLSAIRHESTRGGGRGGHALEKQETATRAEAVKQ